MNKEVEVLTDFEKELYHLHFEKGLFAEEIVPLIQISELSILNTGLNELKRSLGRLCMRTQLVYVVANVVKCEAKNG